LAALPPCPELEVNPPTPAWVPVLPVVPPAPTVVPSDDVSAGLPVAEQAAEAKSARATPPAMTAAKARERLRECFMDVLLSSDQTDATASSASARRGRPPRGAPPRRPRA